MTNKDFFNEFEYSDFLAVETVLDCIHICVHNN
jgi:hypothetical protein